MASRKIPPATWLLYAVTLVVILIFGPEIFHRRGDVWVGAGLVLLVLAVPVAAYLCRPSVRAELPPILTLFAARRALNRGDYDRAEVLCRKASARGDALRTNRDLSLGMALAQLGDVLRARGRLAESEEVVRQALKHYDQASPPQPALRNTTLLSLAAISIELGRCAEGELLCREALSIFKSDPVPKHEYGATALLNLGHVYIAHENLEEAESAMRQALDMLSNEVKRGQPLGCYALLNLAELYRRMGRLDEAEPLARRALALYEKCLSGRQAPTLARFLNVLAEIVRKQGRLDEAESLCLQSQTLTEEAFGSEHISLDRCLSTLARIRAAQGRSAEAEPLLRRSVSILERVVPEHLDRITRMEEYAALLRNLGRPSEADEWDAKAKESSV